MRSCWRLSQSSSTAPTNAEDVGRSTPLRLHSSFTIGSLLSRAGSDRQPSTSGASRRRYDAETLGLDTECGVELAAEVLHGDRGRQLDDLSFREMLLELG